MIFEELANELLLELFECFNITQLLRAFRCLNSRFDKLLVIYLRNLRYLDFRSISKNDFNFICQHHLPSIINKTISLTLSNDDETPQQIELFFSYNFILSQFLHLQSLSFYQINSQSIIQHIVIDLVHLSNLTHLNFIECCLSSLYEDHFYLIDNIWKLPKLIHLKLHDTSNGRINFISTRSISLSMEYMSIKHFCMSMNDIYQFMKHKPHLRHVQIYTHLDDEDIHVVEHFPSIIKFELNDERFSPLNLFFMNHIPRGISVFSAMPNLYHLTIETPFIFMDGHRWRCFISNFLPKLKIFQFKMAIYFNNFDSVKERANYILDSFQNQFWTDEHQWFVRCHWNSENKYNQCILFYTLPYIFSHLSITNNHLWCRSTCPYDRNDWSSSRVHCLSYNSYLTEHNIPSKKIESYEKSNKNQTNSSSKINKIFRFGSRKTRSFSLSDDNPTIVPCSLEKTVKITSVTPSLFNQSPLLHFSNIRKLIVELPLDEHFWSIIPKLNRLTSLNIKLSTEKINQSHLQELFDRTPHLYSLSFNLNFTSSSKLPLFYNNSLSIRRLNFKENNSFDQCFFFNNDQCIALSRSSFVKQCEVLSIGVRHRRSILFLINRMIKLRALNVQCQDDQHGSKTLSPKSDDLIRWLQCHLPSTIFIERDFLYNRDIRLWIR
ncbi:unnamed protein product [Rotaria sp. Silwood2]|nr:unnamed protein product [Rotaria sp. Silwood2]CAF4319315.1 unnamed protein product [Rotaria sp. Silwood2]